MKLHKLTCPNCYGSLELKIDNGNKHIYCHYCGQKFFVDDGKQELNINIKKHSEHTRKIVDEAEIIRAKKEANEEKDAFKMFIICMLLLAAIPICIFVGGFISDHFAEEKATQAQLEGKICAGYYADYEEQNYSAVVEQFEIMGFENIKTVDLDDAGLFKNRRDTVDSVSINGHSFRRDDYFYPTDQVVITYH